MADCTKTAEFLREWDRMCSALKCADCPAGSTNNGHACLCEILRNKYSEDAIAIVQKWSDEHPALTWEGKLKELLPNGPIAQLTDEYCPFHLFGDHAPCRDSCKTSCVECWNGEYKEG